MYCNIWPNKKGVLLLEILITIFELQFMWNSILYIVAIDNDILIVERSKRMDGFNVETPGLLMDSVSHGIMRFLVPNEPSTFQRFFKGLRILELHGDIPEL